jgi:hypothetical protein
MPELRPYLPGAAMVSSHKLGALYQAGTGATRDQVMLPGMKQRMLTPR